MNEHGLHDLVARAKAGDRTARGELFTRTRPALWTYARKVLGDNWDDKSTSDLVSQTWERALTRLDGFQGGADDHETCGALLAWLQTIMRRIWMNGLRGQRLPGRVVSLDARPPDASSTATPACEPAADGETPSFDMKQEDTRRVVHAALERLPALTRQIIEMRLWEERTLDEIAQALGRDPKTVSKYFHEGLRLLKPHLKDLE